MRHAFLGVLAFFFIISAAFPQTSLLVAGGDEAQTKGDLLRTREVTLDTLALADLQPGSKVRLALFDDAGFDTEIALVQRRGPASSNFTLQGRVIDDPIGAFSLVVEGNHISGGLWSSRGTFGLAPTGRTDIAGRPVAQARELHPRAVTQCAADHDHDLIAPRDTRLLARYNHHHNAHPGEPLDLYPEGATPPSGACSCGDDGGTIDVLFLYTTLAKNAAGGAPAIQSRVNDAVAATNLVYVNSNISTGTGPNRLMARVAGFAEFTYDEIAPDWLDHLNRLADPDDGFIDNALTLRDNAHADVVCLIIDDARFFGGAAFYALHFRDAAAQVMNWRGMGSGNLTYAHELGHTYGCAHDRGNSSFALFPYAWGHSFVANGTTYGTIMSSTGQTIPLFSNPFINFMGQPIGVGLDQPLPSYNTLAIQEARWTIASWADSGRIIDCNGNGIDDSIDIAAHTSADLNGNCRPDECERRIYVDANNTGVQDGLTWNTAYTNLAEAMIAASLECNNISEIWVADGTYTPLHRDSIPGDRFARLNLRTGLAIYGSFQGKSRPGRGETSLDQRSFELPFADFPTFPTILSGAIGTPADNDNSMTIVVAENTDSSALLDGVIIERAFSDFDGGGVYISNASPTLRRCVIRNNRAGAGGAVAINGFGANPLLDRCEFRNNTATGGGGAIVLRDGCSLNLTAGRLLGNSTPGGGGAIVMLSSNLQTIGCGFGDNAAGDGGGGIAAYGSSSVTLDQSTFFGNQGRWGGACAFADSSFNASRCEFVENHATAFSGGGFDLFNVAGSTLVSCALVANASADGGAGLSLGSGCNVALINCTVAGNTAPNSGGGIGMFSATLTLSNSILARNQGGAGQSLQDQQLTRFSGSTAVVNFSCVQTNTGAAPTLGGSGNIGVDPGFPSGPMGFGSSHLPSGSPCIDAGNNNLVPAGNTFDLYSSTRFSDDPTAPDTGVGTPPIVDMGASEFFREFCPADFNQDGFRNPDDLADFITCFFLDVQFPGFCPRADFNQDEFRNPDDLADFITTFFLAIDLCNP